MAGAFWCVGVDDRRGHPKKVTAELIGEARRWGQELKAGVEAVWLTDKAEADGLRQLAGRGADPGGADGVGLGEDTALAPVIAGLGTARAVGEEPAVGLHRNHRLRPSRQRELL